MKKVPRAVKICIACGKEFEIERWRLKDKSRGKYCSVKCSSTRTGEFSKNWKGGKQTIKCIGCGKPFKEWSHVGQRFCSHRCFLDNDNVGQRLAHLASQRVGEKHPNWKGGRRVVGGGYILVKSNQTPSVRRNGYILEHRLVMENKTGKYLNPNEIVHHIDGNVQNNSVENLLLLEDQSEHMILHRSQR